MRKDEKGQNLDLVVAAISLATVPSAVAQQSGKTPKIAVLYSGSISSGTSSLDAFRQGLRELGYVEGKNIVIEYRYGDGKTEQLPKLAAELMRHKPDLLVTAGSAGIIALKKLTSATPIVIAAIGDAVGGGYVQSLAKPGGNLTGLSFLDTEITTKRMELLKEVLPRMTRLAVLRHSNSNSKVLAELRAAAPPLKLRLEIVSAQTPDEFETVL